MVCLGGAIWWMPMRLRPRVRLCDCVAPFLLAAYARAKPCCLWLVVLACVPTLVLYCVLAVLRSGLTAIEIKWLLLLLLLLMCISCMKSFHPCPTGQFHHWWYAVCDHWRTRSQMCLLRIIPCEAKTAPFYFCNSFGKTASITTIFGTHTPISSLSPVYFILFI